MRLSFISLSFAVMLLLSACGDAERVTTVANAGPAWLNTPPTAPGMLYGVGVCEPGQRDKAIAAARVDLAGQIEISINAERQQDDRVAESQVTGKALIGRLETESHSAVRTRVTIDALPGLKVDTIHEDQYRTAALVSLDRQLWASSLRNRLAEIDADLVSRRDEICSNAGAHMSIFTITIRTYRTLLPSLEERAEVARRLRVAAPGQAIPAPAFTAGALRTALFRELSSMRIALVGKDESAISIIPKVYERCTAIGLKAVSHDAAADLRLSISARITTTNINGDLRADGLLDGNLGQTTGDRRLGGFAVTARASSTTPDQAIDRVRAKLTEQLAKQFDDHLLEWLESL